MYCSESNLRIKFGEAEITQLTRRSQLPPGSNPADVATQVVLAAITEAGSDIDKRLRMKGWAVPLAEPSADIVAIACDLARFHLFQGQMVELVEKAYLRRIKELDDYVAGKLMLDIGSPEVKTIASAGDVDFVKGASVFTPEALVGF